MRFTLLGVAWIVAMLAGTGPAFADTATLSVTTAAGQPDPAAGVPRVFTVSGVSAKAQRIFVKYRAPGGAACAPTAQSDSGETFFGSVYGSDVDGPFNVSQAFTWGPPGPVAFCIWIAGSQSTITTPFARTITFRGPTGAIAATVNPGAPQVNQRATITVMGASEAPAKVYAKMRPAGGAPCAPSSDADPGNSLLSEERVNGSFTLEASLARPAAGAFQVCVWLAASSSDALPIATAQARLFNVTPLAQDAPPPPPCIVPKVNYGIRLATMSRRIRANHCTPGTVRYLRSRKIPRRAIVRLSSRAGSKLQSGAALTIYVSSGYTKKR